VGRSCDNDQVGDERHFTRLDGLTFYGVGILARYLYLFRYADDSKLTEWLPDDAFYYLILGATSPSCTGGHLMG
jgi:hypothetical protein